MAKENTGRAIISTLYLERISEVASTGCFFAIEAKLQIQLPWSPNELVKEITCVTLKSRGYLRARSEGKVMATTQSEQFGQQVIAAIEEHRQEIVQVAREIHAYPETAFEEHFASKLLVEAMQRHDFKVEYPVGGLETAFCATKLG